MRMIENDQVVALRQIGDRMRLETFERLALPTQAYGRVDGGGRFERTKATRMIPRQPQIARHVRRHWACAMT
jgi:hypothetical protein